MAARFDPCRHALALALLSCLVLVTAATLLRPITPVDETRYLTVAWEMRLSGDGLLLTLNGAPYGHKPPLLFWLLNLGWSLFGVSEWWPRALTGLFAAGALVLVAGIARHLAPGRDDVAAMTLWITASALFWMGFTGAVMFDTMLAFFVLLALRAVLAAARGGGLRAWALAGVALGLGILAKGPVALLHVLPAALLGPWWWPASHDDRGRPPSRTRWYAGIALAVLIAGAIALSWALPSAMAGGSAFGREIFWSQSVDRIVSTTHHLRPWWWYLPMLAVLMLPWLFVPAVWGGLWTLARDGRWRSPALRFALAWFVPVLLAFSVFRGKQVQYLLPEIPAIAFVIASGLAARGGGWSRVQRAVVAGLFVALGALLLALPLHPRIAHLVGRDELPTVGWSVAALAVAAWLVWREARHEPWRPAAALAAGSLAMVVGFYFGFGRAAFDVYDLHPTARVLAGIERAGHPIAHAGKYHGQFHFLGRLERPFVVFDGRRPLLDWAAREPEGRVVIYSRALPTHAGGARPEAVQKFKGRFVSVWRAADLPAIADEMLPQQAVDDDGTS